MNGPPSILVPVDVLEGESLPEGVPELLAHANVVLLGYHAIPEQTPPGQARLQYEERGNARLEEYATIFEEAGATVDTQLVFTHDEQKTIDRMIYEHECLAVLVPNTTGTVEDVLVAVRGTVGADRLSRVVAGLFGGRDVSITLYHVAGEEESEGDVEMLLESVTDRLTDLNVDHTSIETWIERERAPVEAIRDASVDFDVVVMGETDPSMATFVFGMPADKVAEGFLGPVLVVQRERPSDEDE